MGVFDIFSTEPTPRKFVMKLFDENGNEIASKSFLLFENCLLETEYQAHMKGRELGRDAIYHAGYWDKFQEQRAAASQAVNG